MTELEKAVEKQTQSQQILADELSHRLQRCPLWQDLIIFCGEVCGSKGRAEFCPIYFKESGRLALARRGEY